MKIYGPFHALKNPLVLASLGLTAASDISDIYADYEKKHADDFLVQSLLADRPITEMEGGPFRKLASKLTGGMVSPNIEAGSSDVANEILALRKQKGEDLRQAGEVANIREKVGPGPFGAGSAFSGEARRLGLGDLSQSIPGDESKELLNQVRRQTLQNNAPDVKLQQAVERQHAIDQQKISDESSPQARENKYNLGFAGGSGAAAGKLSVESSPAGLSNLGLRTRITHEAGVSGTATGVDNLTLGQYRTRPAGKVFVDRATLTPASSDMKVKDANSNPDLVAIAQGKDEQALSETRSMLKQLGQLDRLVDKVFPAMPRSSGLAGDISLTKAGLTHWNNRRTDPTIQRFYAAKGLLIEYIRKMQSRYPSAIELGDIGQELVPEPGGISHYGKPIRSDSNEVAHQKIYQLQQKLKDSYLNAAVESTEEGTDDAIDKSLDEAIPSE